MNNEISSTLSPLLPRLWIASFLAMTFQRYCVIASLRSNPGANQPFQPLQPFQPFQPFQPLQPFQPFHPFTLSPLSPFHPFHPFTLSPRLWLASFLAMTMLIDGQQDAASGCEPFLFTCEGHPVAIKSVDENNFVLWVILEFDIKRDGGM